MRRNNCGFTLMELIAAIVVLVVGVLGVGSVFLNTVGHSSKPYLMQQSRAVLNQIMADIMSKKFDNYTPDGGGVVPLSKVNIGRESVDGDYTQDFDDVDDFNGLNCDTGVKTCFPDVPSGFHVSITVTYAKLLLNVISPSSHPSNFKLIKVKMYSKAMKHEVYSIEAVKGNY